MDFLGLRKLEKRLVDVLYAAYSSTMVTVSRYLRQTCTRCPTKPSGLTKQRRKERVNSLNYQFWLYLYSQSRDRRVCVIGCSSVCGERVEYECGIACTLKSQFCRMASSKEAVVATIQVQKTIGDQSTKIQ